MFERYIAIDNVCAWPNLTRLPDGAITTAIFNQPTHGGWEGDVECWASEDEGYTWRLRGVPAKHEPGTNRMNVAAGCGHDGRLIVLASGWSNRNPIGSYSSPHEGAVLPIWVCISRDGGETWTQEGSVALPSHSDSRLIPFGDIIKLGEMPLEYASMVGHNQANTARIFISVSMMASRGLCRDVFKMAIQMRPHHWLVRTAAFL